MSLAAHTQAPIASQLLQCQRLARVLTVTQTMLQHAEQGEWEAVAELERGRREDLSACFEESPSLADSALIGEALAALLTLNEELMAKLKEAKAIVMESGMQLSRSRNAAVSYEETSASR
tara:strand:+ start:72125 stop:72484 length:360 start_codon:yes stop_codon:yes gene_type:complete